jgi:hypothetical protein
MKRILIILISLFYSDAYAISSELSLISDGYPKNQYLVIPKSTVTNIGGNGTSPNESHPFLIIGVGILAGELVVLSNDFYLYPSYSFVKGFFEDQDYVRGIGYIFGLRKTFKHSAIEYGMSITTFSDRYYMSDGTNTWAQYYADKKPGIHINYVHQILYNKTPSWQKIYIGPTINLVNDFGYGGIIGTELKFAKRFKFDVRYEYSSQTNQIQAGIIFNFQREYFWRKH